MNKERKSPENHKNLWFILVGFIVVIFALVIFYWINQQKPSENLPIVAKMPIASSSFSVIVNKGLITPNNFTTAPGSDVMLAVIFADGQEHNIVFSDSTLELEKKVTNSKDIKVTTFKLPAIKEGVHEFHCTIPGHENETAKIYAVTAKTKID